MSRPSSHSPDDLPLFADSLSASWGHSLKDWLWRYRLLVILTAVWLGLIGVATIAYSELLFTSRTLEADTPRQRSAIVAEPDLPSSSVASSSMTAMSMETVTVPWWSMAALVGTCALGCIAISRRLQAPPRTRQRRRRSPHRQSRRSSRQTAAPPVKRLQPSAGEEPLVRVETRPSQGKAHQGSGSELHPSAATSPAPDGAPASGSPAAAVTVVPSEQAHPLDVPDSLVHDLDLRQRRSLSSLL